MLGKQANGHVLYTETALFQYLESIMALEKNNESGYQVSTSLKELLAGLQRQREELGSVADEILELFERSGVRLPPDQEGEHSLNP